MTRPSTSPLGALVDLIHSGSLDDWKERNRKALAELFGTRYPKRAETVVALRAPDMRGSDSGVPYAAYIAPCNPDSGAYGGMSFVVFPIDGHAGSVATTAVTTLALP